MGQAIQVADKVISFSNSWMRRRLIAVVVCAVFIAATPAWPCGYDSTTQIFTTPGGRQIHIVAQEHAHAHPGDPLLNTLMSSAEPTELAPAIRSWIARHGSLVQVTSEARGRIRGLLQQRRLNWVALELGPDEVTSTHDELFRELDHL